MNKQSAFIKRLLKREPREVIEFSSGKELARKLHTLKESAGKGRPRTPKP